MSGHAVSGSAEPYGSTSRWVAGSLSRLASCVAGARRAPGSSAANCDDGPAVSAAGNPASLKITADENRSAAMAVAPSASVSAAMIQREVVLMRMAYDIALE